MQKFVRERARHLGVQVLQEQHGTDFDCPYAPAVAERIWTDAPFHNSTGPVSQFVEPAHAFDYDQRKRQLKLFIQSRNDCLPKPPSTARDDCGDVHRNRMTMVDDDPAETVNEGSEFGILYVHGSSGVVSFVSCRHSNRRARSTEPGDITGMALR